MQRETVAFPVCRSPANLCLLSRVGEHGSLLWTVAPLGPMGDVTTARGS